MKRIIFVSSIAAFAAGIGCAKKTPPAEEPVAAAPQTKPAAPQQADVIPEQVARMIANFKRVHFEFNSSDLSTDTRNALMENVDLMRKNPSVKVEIQGHCDSRGTAEYNLALGDRRARAVVDYMVRAGIEKNRFTVVSYGKERPLEDSEGENAWAKNRRAEFRLTWKPEELADLQGSTD